MKTINSYIHSPQQAQVQEMMKITPKHIMTRQLKTTDKEIILKAHLKRDILHTVEQR